MVSKQAQEMKEFLRSVFVADPDWRTTDWAEIRKEADAAAVRQPIPGEVTISEDFLNGIHVERIRVPEHNGKVIFHIHGGGMTIGNSRSARFMLAHTGTLCKRDTVSVDYRLCPEYSQPAAVEDCAAAYQGLLQEYAPQDIALLGESAGGMLVLALLAYLKQHELPMPSCACVISGSADPLYESPSMIENQSTEVVVCLNLRNAMNEYYFCGGDPDDPILNPLSADISGWPPIYFHACNDEILRDESIRMHEKLKAAGIPTKLTIKEDLFHCYMLYDLPESYEAFQEIADFFQEYN